MVSNSKRSIDAKTKFTEAEKNWNLQKLYEDLREAKQQCCPGMGKHKALTDIEKCHLRGLLCGCPLEEIAIERGIKATSLKETLSTTLYRYIKELLNLDSEESFGHWTNVSDLLAKAGYKIQLSEQTTPDTLDLAEREKAIAKPHQESGEAVDASVRELNAKRGVDYDRLRNLLAIGKWREADEETRSLILCLVCREIEGSLRARDINKLPSQDLQTIDKLWVKYSGGRFGFSVQKRLWQDVVGSRANPGYGTLRRFGERVGWYVKGSWLSWSNLSFSVDSAPIGYLPTTSFMIYGNRLLNSAAYLESFFEVEAEHGSGLNVSLFFYRVETCKL